MPITLPAIFSDAMVLQREIPAPVWGWGAPGDAVEVALAGASVRTAAGADGRWLVELPALPAGGPHELRFNDTVVRDVLVGEVWVCCGQSNMELPVAAALRADEEIAAARHPRLRMFTVAYDAAPEPAEEVTGGWAACAPATVGAFSATGYFFGRDLQRALGVPVGLIHAAWGGSLCEAWTSRDALLAEPALRGVVDAYAAIRPQHPSAMADAPGAPRRLARGLPADPGNRGVAEGWADPLTDAADWPAMALPQPWQSAGLDFSGVVWFRREVELPASWAGQELLLELGGCDKADIAYFNNVPVGGLSHLEDPDSWRVPRRYRVPGRLVAAGRNVIAVRVYSHCYAGGLLGPAEAMRLSAPGLAGAAPLPLSGAWRYRVEHNFGRALDHQTPYGLFNAMIAPLIPYGIRGALWYQGESNEGRATPYGVLFPAMICDWRRRWGQGDFPFLFVQLPNFGPDQPDPSESRRAVIREAQGRALSLPNTGMAVTIDIGEADDNHPRNKQEVGRRLARIALATVHGRAVVASGPRYRSMQVEGGSIRLFFDDPGGGLAATANPLPGFAIAGADRRFTRAEARIDGDTVLAASPRVPHPVAVRYAWADNPPCSLYNRAGLPASPFRTDRWPTGDGL